MQVVTNKQSAQAFIALGANIDKPLHQLQAAIDLLECDHAIDVVATSPIYRSAAYGVTDQNDFFNAVIEIRTRYTPIALLETLLANELVQGRVRKRHWGPRCIDLDLLSYEDQRWATNRLTLPHPGISLRRFVLLPLRDIAPQYVLTNKSITDLIEECEPQEIEKLTDISLHYSSENAN